MTPTPSKIVAMLKKRPRACEAMGVEERQSDSIGTGFVFSNTPVHVSCFCNDEDGGCWHQAMHDLATGRCVRLCWAAGMEPFQNAVGGWCVYDRDTGQPVTHPFESPLEAMLEYLQTREER